MCRNLLYFYIQILLKRGTLGTNLYMFWVIKQIWHKNCLKAFLLNKKNRRKASDGSMIYKKI